MKVYRFISEATVEENIYLRQVYKQVTEAREVGRGERVERRREWRGRESGEGERERGMRKNCLYKFVVAVCYKT